MPEFNGHFSTVGIERVLIEDDVSVACIKVTSASDMKKYLTIAYRVVLDKGGLGKAIGLQAHFFSTTGITLVKIDMEHTVYKTSA